MSAMDLLCEPKTLVTEVGKLFSKVCNFRHFGDATFSIFALQLSVIILCNKRKRLRYWLFQAARSAVAHAEEFKALHVYYTTRQQNPLKKMQSLIVIACKILRIVFTILQTGRPYSPTKMLQDIKRTADTAAQAA